MTALAYTVTDSATMLRRNLKHQLRYPSVTLMLVGMPIVFLLLFVYVFGGQLGAGLGTHPHGDRTAYLTYVVPGILIMTVASAALGTALSVAMDMTEGIIDRFRTMAIARGAVLTGHVVGSLIQTIDRARHRARRRPGDRLPPDGRPACLGGRGRCAAPVRARARVSLRRARPGRKKR